ncbi:hypothetical protein ACWEF6_02920 [Amycolatopsis sp. NPDC004772]
MTLKTSVAIGKAYPVREVFEVCRSLLNTPEGTPFEHEDVTSSWRKGQRQILNPGGIGLDAWLWIYYGADGPMIHSHDDWCATEVDPCKWDDTGKYSHGAEDVRRHVADIAEDPTKNGWAAIEVTFDTAYGYRGKSGENCSMLHARLIAELGRWLDEKALPWKWQNEYTGEWFDRFEGLGEFVNAHQSTGADSWFRETVVPIILAGGVS